MDNYKKLELAHQLNSAFKSEKQKEYGIIKYSESTQTYYSDEELAKEHVKQINEEDVQKAETVESLEYYMEELKKKMPNIEKPNRNLSNKNKWHSKRY